MNVVTKVLKVFETYGPMTVAEASRKTRLSRAATYARVRALTDSGALHITKSIRQGSRGAEAAVFKLTSAGRVALGRRLG